MAKSNGRGSWGEGKTYLVLGGGMGGVVAAATLRKHLDSEHSVIMVDKRSFHIFCPILPWIMVGHRRPDQATASFAKSRTRGVSVLQETVEEFDFDNQEVRTDAGRHSYDELVISLGTQHKPQAVPGFEDGAYSLYELKQVEELYERLKAFLGGKIVVLVTTPIFKCPPAPYEAVMLLDAFFRDRGIRPKVELELVTPNSRPLPVDPPSSSKTFLDFLAEKHISFRPASQVRQIDSQHHQIELEDGTKLSYDLLVGVPPHFVAEVLAPTPLIGNSAYVDADPHTLKTNREHVHAIGDCVGIPLPGGGLLPKAGIIAELEAKVVTANLAAESRGQDPRAQFTGKGFCFSETGNGEGTLTYSDFYHEPQVQTVSLPPSKAGHLAKVSFEKAWFARWF